MVHKTLSIGNLQFYKRSVLAVLIVSWRNFQQGCRHKRRSTVAAVFYRYLSHAPAGELRRGSLIMRILRGLKGFRRRFQRPRFTPIGTAPKFWQQTTWCLHTSYCIVLHSIAETGSPLHWFQGDLQQKVCLLPRTRVHMEYSYQHMSLWFSWVAAPWIMYHGMHHTVRFSPYICLV